MNHLIYLKKKDRKSDKEKKKEIMRLNAMIMITKYSEPMNTCGGYGVITFQLQLLLAC